MSIRKLPPFVLLLFALSGFSQVRIKGTLVNESQEAIGYATVSLVNPDSKAVIAYTLSDELGFFDMELTSTLPLFNLNVSALNHNSTDLSIPNKSQDLLIEMTTTHTQLEEILIKTTPITQRQDTISFDLNRFARKNDRVLEDVLQNIPGIEVESSGQIKYQGQAINKFYVEGMDLMQGSYTSITKAMPNQHISKLEVLENHQPIKMLTDKVMSESPAINIRLKNKISFSGSGKTGIGASPFLWNSTASPMFFSSSLQYLFNYDTNNAGLDISKKIQNLYSYGTYDTYSYTKPVNQLLSIAETALPQIDESRYLFNTSHLLSANLLAKLTPDLELNTNIFYYNNEFERQGAYVSAINTQTEKQTIRYSFHNHSFTFQESLKSQFTFTNNTSKRYFKDFVTFVIHRHKTRGSSTLNNDPLSQRITAPSYTLQNSLSTLLPLKNGKFINVKSIIDYTKDQQLYEVSPSHTINLPYEDLYQYATLGQDYLNRSFHTKNAFSLSWGKRAWVTTQQFTTQYTLTRFYSDLHSRGEDNSSLSDSYQNDLKYGIFKNTLRTILNYKGSKLNLNIDLPVSSNIRALTNGLTAHKDTKNKIEFSPSLSALYKLSYMLELKTKLGTSSNYTPVDQLYTQYIFSGLNFQAYNNAIENNQNYFTKTTLEFKNPFNGLFAHAGYSYSKSIKKQILSTLIDSNGQQLVEAIRKGNTGLNQTIDLSIGKFIADISMNIKGDFNFIKTQNDILINHTLTTVKLFHYNYRFEVSNNHFDWLHVSYAFRYAQQQRASAHRYTNSYKNSHRIRIDLTPIQNQSIIWKMDYQENNFNHQTFPNRFMDLTYRFTWSKKRIDFDLEWQNILSLKEYEQVVINDIQTSITIFKLRPSQVLFSVRYVF